VLDGLYWFVDTVRALNLVASKAQVVNQTLERLLSNQSSLSATCRIPVAQLEWAFSASVQLEQKFAGGLLY